MTETKTSGSNGSTYDFADFETTIRYVRNPVFWEDAKRHHDKFQLDLMQEAPLTHGL